MRNYKHKRRLWVGGALVAAMALAGCGGGSGGSGVGSSSGGNLLALLNNNRLVQFRSSNPTATPFSVTIIGLQAAELLIGIDVRPSDNQVYALSNQNRLYRINLNNGLATQVGANGAFALNGTNFGFDFNPVTDRIRVVSDNDQNIRLNPNDGTLAGTDTNLSYAGGDLNNGVNPQVVSAGYTNSVNGAGATTLYVIDSNLDILAIQNPPNNGTLNTVGPLGINADGSTSFDIAPPGSSTPDTAFMVTNGTQLHTVNLATGASTLVGNVTTGGAPVIGLAVLS